MSFCDGTELFWWKRKVWAVWQCVIFPLPSADKPKKCVSERNLDLPCNLREANQDFTNKFGNSLRKQYVFCQVFGKQFETLRFQCLSTDVSPFYKQPRSFRQLVNLPNLQTDKKRLPASIRRLAPRNPQDQTNHTHCLSKDYCYNPKHWFEKRVLWWTDIYNITLKPG